MILTRIKKSEYFLFFHFLFFQSVYSFTMVPFSYRANIFKLVHVLLIFLIYKPEYSQMLTHTHTLTNTLIQTLKTTTQAERERLKTKTHPPTYIHWYSYILLCLTQNQDTSYKHHLTHSLTQSLRHLETWTARHTLTHTQTRTEWSKQKNIKSFLNEADLI